MQVKELIAVLQQMDQEAEVLIAEDIESQGSVDGFLVSFAGNLDEASAEYNVPIHPGFANAKKEYVILGGSD